MKPEANPEGYAGRARHPWVQSSLAFALAFGVAAAAEAGTSYQVIKYLDGVWGAGALIEGSDVKLYGVAEGGGEKAEGSLFKVNKDGTGFAILHSFTALRGGGDGSNPQGLLEGRDGALYGTTRVGGMGGGVAETFGLSEIGNGTVFKVGRDGRNYAVLRRFTGNDGDGAAPWVGLVEGPDQALYGTTLQSGITANQIGYGTVFKLSKDGRDYRVLHHFGLQPGNGATPFAALIAGSDGALYGTTDAGGTAGPRNGTIFRINPDGSGYKVLLSFPQSRDDGRMPRSRLIEGVDGALYGTTQNGGEKDLGTIFKMNNDGSGYKVLHSFTGSFDVQADPQGITEGVLNGKTVKTSSQGDGTQPQALAQSKDGTLYGTTGTGARHGGGAAFEMKPDGTGFTILHHFPAFAGDGSGPCGELIITSEGALYGLTQRTSTNNFATLFRILPAGVR